MANTSAEANSSIETSIKYGQTLKVSNAKLHLKSTFTDSDVKIIINYTSLLDKYYDVVVKNSSIEEFTEEEFMKYIYKPRLLSSDLYGTPELAPLIMSLNNISSVATFTTPKLRLPTREIFEIINEVMILESNAIKLNTNAVYSS